MMGFIILVGLTIGFLQGYKRGIEREDFLKMQQIFNWMGMSTGFAGGRNGDWDGELLFAILKIGSAIFGLYIAKNVNLGFDSIFDIQF